MFCKKCKSMVSVKDTERWVSLKCNCKCAVYYADGHFVVVPKEVYLRNRERYHENV